MNEYRTGSRSGARLSMAAMTIALLSVSGIAAAGEANGAIGGIWVHNWNSMVAFSVSNRTNRPACASYGAGRFVVDTATAQGRSSYSLLLAAKLAGKSITVYGSGNCGIYSDSESVDFLYIP